MHGFAVEELVGMRMQDLDVPGAAREAPERLRRLLAGELRGADVWSQLKAANRVGVTRGTLEERRNPLAIL